MAEPLTLATILKSAITPFTKIGEAIFSSYKKRNQQPTLSIKLDFHNSSRMTRGLSSNNNFPPEGEAIPVWEVGNMNHFYDMSWTYEMSITNDSEYTAYQLYIVEHEGIRLNFNPAFDFTKPITPNTTVTYELKAFYSMFEGTPSQTDEFVKKGPIEVFRIEYTNSEKEVKFYTEFRPQAELRERNSYGRV